MELQDLGSRAFKGAFSLVVRQVFVHGFHIATGILLARWLLPAQFGEIAVLQFLSVIFVKLVDLGLNYRLIQQDAGPRQEDYNSVILFQNLLGGAIVLLAFLSRPVLDAAGVSDRFADMVCALSLVALAYPYVTTPVSRMERALAFDKIAVCESVQVGLYSVVTLLSVKSGMGVWGFVHGSLARYFLGALFVLLYSRWKMGARITFSRIRDNFRFALPYQGSVFLALSREAIVPLFMGRMLGSAAVGYTQWAAVLAGYSLYAQNVFFRLYLPTFSKLQNHRDDLKKALAHVVGWTNRILAPMHFTLFLFAPAITTLVFTEKWLPALPVVYLLTLANSVVATTMPCYELLNSLGKTRITFRLTLIWVIALWLLSLVLIPKFGPLGYAWAILGVTTLNFLLFRECREYLSLKLLREAAMPWLICAPLAALVAALKGMGLLHSTGAFLAALGGFWAAYALATFLLFKSAILRDLKLLTR